MATATKNLNPSSLSSQNLHNVKKNHNVRYLESRRNGPTCPFANRIATLSIQYYRQNIMNRNNSSSSSIHTPTCLSTIIVAIPKIIMNSTSSSTTTSCNNINNFGSLSVLNVGGCWY